MLSKNDILLLLGKGHEGYQIIKNKKYPFIDKDVVAGEKYSYYLVAFNNSGYESQKSHIATIIKK